jgi:hypothetical protein
MDNSCNENKFQEKEITEKSKYDLQRKISNKDKENIFKLYQDGMTQQKIADNYLGFIIDESRILINN